MSTQFLDLVRQQITNTGTGDLNLGAAVSGWLTVALAGGVDGQTYSYGILDPGNTTTQTECGTCVYHAGTNSITRTVAKSTNSNNPINASAQAHIVFGVTAEDLTTLYNAVFWTGIRVGSKIFPFVPNDTSAPTRAANTTNFHAAKDYAFNNGFRDIEVSAGQYWYNPPLYVDATGNLQAPAQLFFNNNPIAGNTLTIYGTVVTYVASGATGLQVNIGANVAATLVNLQAMLAASTDPNLLKFTYTASSTTLTITSISGTPTIVATNVSGCNILSGTGNPSIFAFSLRVKGAGSSLENGRGTALFVLDNTVPAVIIGPGQKCGLLELDLISQVSFTSRAALPSTGAGVQISGGTGGAHGTILSDCLVIGFYLGIGVGWNNGSLGDSTSLVRVSVNNCYKGLTDYTPNSIIIDLTECLFANCTFHIYNTLDHVINVKGGNFSGTNSNHNALTIGTISGFTQFVDNNTESFFDGSNNWSFTAVVSSPDQPFLDGAYDCFVIKTTKFGPVPVQLLSYNSGTHTATFKLFPLWLSMFFQQGGAQIDPSTIGLPAEIQAQTVVYCAERQTIFRGSGFNTSGIHHELPGVVTTLYNTCGVWNSSQIVRADKSFLNYDPSQNNYWTNGSSPASDAITLCQAMFPFINQTNTAALDVQDADWGTQTSWPLTFALTEIEHGISKFSSPNGWPIINLLTPSDPFQPGQSIDTWTGWMGAGKWNNTPFIPTNANRMQEYWELGTAACEFWGWGPAQNKMPRLRLDTFTSIAGGPPAINAGNPPFVPLHGQTMYQVVDGPTAFSGTNFALHDAFVFRSNHHYFSYGQSLPITWHCAGKSQYLRVSDTSKLFAGMYLLLNDGGAINQNAIITGVFPALNAVTIFPYLYTGTAGTDYTAASIGQENYNIKVMDCSEPWKERVDASGFNTTVLQGDLTGARKSIMSYANMGGFTLTTRTAAQMFADDPMMHTGKTWEVVIQNTGLGTITFAGGTGVTIAGTATIGASVARTYRVSVQSPTTMTFENAGAMTL